MNALLIFDMHDLNGALLLKVSFVYLLLTLLVPLALILPSQQDLYHYIHTNLILG